MPGVLLQKELDGLSRLKTFTFWRNQAVAFCVFSLLGHWVEIPYCMFNDYFFGIVDPNSGVFTDPLEPFMVYGFAIVACNIILVPVRNLIAGTYVKYPWLGILIFFIVATIIAMDGELIQGFLQNQPDEFGNYPLWDNSQLPFNVAGQAWLVNDVLLGLIITVYIWGIEPFMARLMNLSKPQWRVDVISAVIVVAFIILVLIKFVFFPVH